MCRSLRVKCTRNCQVLTYAIVGIKVREPGQSQRILTTHQATWARSDTLNRLNTNELSFREAERLVFFLVTWTVGSWNLIQSYHRTQQWRHQHTLVVHCLSTGRAHMVELKWDKDACISLPYLLIPVTSEDGETRILLFPLFGLENWGPESWLMCVSQILDGSITYHSNSGRSIVCYLHFHLHMAKCKEGFASQPPI